MTTGLLQMVSGTSAAAEPAETDEPLVIPISPEPDISLVDDEGDVPREFTNVIVIDGTIELDVPAGGILPPQGCRSVESLVGGKLVPGGGHTDYELGELAGQGICIGTSIERDSPFPPLEVSFPPGMYPSGLSGGVLENEAAAYLAAAHDVTTGALITANAAADVRAYAYTRMLSIVAKRLYSVPLDEQEQKLYRWLAESLKTRELAIAQSMQRLYDEWTHDPCGWEPPSPPSGSGLDPIANPTASAQRCTLPIWDIMNLPATPSYETFKIWAEYDNPSVLMDISTSDAGRAGLGNTNAAILGGGVAAGAVTGAAAFALGASAPTGLITAISHALYIGSFALKGGTVAISTVATMVGTIGGSVVGSLVLFATVTASVIVELLADMAVPKAIAENLAKAGRGDPMRIEGENGDGQRYSTLDFGTLEQPAQGGKAYALSKAFNDRVYAAVMEQLMVDRSGQVVDDAPTYVDVPHTDKDKYFVLNGDDVSTVYLDVPDGAKNADGEPIEQRKVYFSNGFLMTSERVDGVWGPALPQLSVQYLDAEGGLSLMTVVKHKTAEKYTKRSFGISSVSEDSDGVASIDPERVDDWTFRDPSGDVLTVQLGLGLRVLPDLGVTPTAQGNMYPGHNITFRPNITPSQDFKDTEYTWTITRQVDGGDDETIDLGDRSHAYGFQESFHTPGYYTATLEVSGTVEGAPLTVGGQVSFSIKQPGVETVEEPRLVDRRNEDRGSFLDLRLTEPVPEDTFNVEVTWATDTQGELKTTTYEVACTSSRHTSPDGVWLGDACETQPYAGALDVREGQNSNWDRLPVFRAGADEFAASVVQVTATSRNYGGTWTQSFETGGDYRPHFVDRAPEVTVATGQPVDLPGVAAVIPSDIIDDFDGPNSFPDEATARKFTEQMNAALPPSFTLSPVWQDAEEQLVFRLQGEPQTADVGTYQVPLRAEQSPQGSGREAPPAVLTLNVVPTVDEPRAVLTDVPSGALPSYDRTWPGWNVALAVVDDEDAPDPLPQAHCFLETGSISSEILVDQPCNLGEPFPWPEELSTGRMDAAVWIGEKGDRDGDAYEVSFFTTTPYRALSANAEAELHAEPGDELTIPVTVTNDDFNDASGVALQVDVPEGLELLSLTPRTEDGGATSAWSCDIAALECVLNERLGMRSTTASVDVTVRVNDGVTEDQVIELTPIQRLGDGSDVHRNDPSHVTITIASDGDDPGDDGDGSGGDGDGSGDDGDGPGGDGPGDGDGPGGDGPGDGDGPGGDGSGDGDGPGEGDGGGPGEAQEPWIRSDVSSAAPGGQLHLAAGGFEPGERVTVTIHSTPRTLAVLVADEHGAVEGTVRVPSDIAAGAHTITLTGQRSGVEVSTPLMVEHRAALPIIGSTDGLWVHLLALVLLLLGAAMIAWRTRVAR
ncbi:hypothetical protein [Aeromicrobium phragmitis]|uniref:hypothetical protein n=1 Tax=Aeromicrobium phragmitis TaxID=2478914 RepID=UPI001AA07CAB|nr:hypothetical protein [Aeromicrobium phragmitis]